MGNNYNSHKTLSSDEPVCDQATYEDIGDVFIKQRVDKNNDAGEPL